MAGTVTGWLKQLKEGDESVTEKLWSHYSPGLTNRLTRRCQALKICDEDDIATTSFYRSVSSLQTRKQYRCSNRTEFWRLLMKIARHEIIDCLKYDRASCRGGGQTIVSLSEDNVDAPSIEIDDSDEKMLLEKFEQLSADLNRPEFMQIIDFKQQGLSNAEIATKMDYSLRTIQYIISDIKVAWKKCFCVNE